MMTKQISTAMISTAEYPETTPNRYSAFGSVDELKAFHARDKVAREVHRVTAVHERHVHVDTDDAFTLADMHPAAIGTGSQYGHDPIYDMETVRERINAGQPVWIIGQVVFTAVPTETSSITVCLLGDDRAREYPVAWMGTGDVSEHGGPFRGECRVALVTTDQDREVVIYEHPEYGWTSLNTSGIRDVQPAEGYPAMSYDRLEDAD